MVATVIEFKPCKHKHAWHITLPLYFPTATRELKQVLGATGKPMIESARKLLEGTKEPSVPELMRYNQWVPSHL
ncbi:uncharacterized protein A1O9_12069 [Exophiala aquamarina CBS 119918]|uniref:Uncharacterized protein n=1 Tax=Exophiala aquamarina CBS 119918 TaxID=1182545 RepID=A0A072NWF5_9EURO|nr:uncharacterized protein A1O9_12069 [Exophiala aquamarina CBS 119918]KEF51732.1 hypothetical protein A1O9_12069 [Exophiala aquamarina CBS 119918]